MFDVTADGNRLVVLRQEDNLAIQAKRTHVTMVFNFLDEVGKVFGGQ